MREETGWQVEAGGRGRKDGKRGVLQQLKGSEKRLRE